MSDANEKLLEYLSRSHYLPSFNLPIDSIPFIARAMENGDEKIIARMSDGLEKALVGYAPGKELTYKKQNFIVGGIFIEYMPRRDIPEGTSDIDEARIRMNEVMNRTSYWYEIPTNIKYFHMCKKCKHTLECTVKKPEDVDELAEPCKVCKSEDEWLSLPMIRPPGFAPLIRQSEGRPNFAEVDDPNFSADSNIFHSKTRWPTSLISSDKDIKTQMLVEDRAEISYHQKIQILDINAGMGEYEKEEGKMGFAFCKDCGHLNPNKIKTDHLRPYAITEKDGMFSGVFQHETLKEKFNTNRVKPCSSSNKTINGFDRLLLGRLFTTNVLSLKIKWDDNWVDLQDKGGREIGRRGAMSLCQAFLQAICDADTGFAISPTDIGGDIRQTEDQDGFEIFVYERVDGGAGLLTDVFESIKSEWRGIDERGSIFTKVHDILSGKNCIRTEKFSDGIRRKISQPCEHICSGCLQDFATQHISAEIGREAGHQFCELAFDPAATDFNHHNAARYLKHLAEEMKNNAKTYDVEIEEISSTGQKKFLVLDGEEKLKDQRDIDAQIAWEGIIINDKLFSVKPEILLGEIIEFTAKEIIQDPIRTKKIIENEIRPIANSDDIKI